MDRMLQLNVFDLKEAPKKHEQLKIKYLLGCIDVTVGQIVESLSQGGNFEGQLLNPYQGKEKVKSCFLFATCWRFF